MKAEKRIWVPDLIKAIWILGIVLVHTTIYAFDGVYSMDFDNPPIVMIVFSILTYWGALFTLIAAWLHTTSIYKRLSSGMDLFQATIKNSLVSWGFLMILHYLYNFVFGVLQLNFDKGKHSYTVITSLIRFGKLVNLDWSRFTDGSTFSTVAFTILVLGIVIYFKEKYRLSNIRYLVALYIAGFIFLLSGFLRVEWYQYVTLAEEQGRFLLSIPFSFLLEKPYPMLPYLAFGLFGSLISEMYLAKLGRKKLLTILLSVPVLIFPIALKLILNNEISIATVDKFGLGRTYIELAIFIIAIAFMIAFAGNTEREFVRHKKSKFNFTKTVQLFSIYSVSTYMYQPFVSELTKHVWNFFGTDWAYDVNKTIYFGLFNVILWLILINLLPQLPKRLTFEYWWLKWYQLYNRETKKTSWL